ncbi:DUF6242 domain-containing protein [Parapedobacter deserti]|uniref:DUF6242 domain-containing protein n=1 Tax=Parapedobacter deserti TaxID=1912957 RepID=A0ABV7JHS9_9SPHI
MKRTLQPVSGARRYVLLFVVGGLTMLGQQACKKNKEALSNLTGISSFAIKDFEDHTFTIDQNTLTISNVDSLPYLTDPSALIAVFSVIQGSVVEVNGVIQESGVTPNDFSNELTYKTTAEDGMTIRNYKVKVNIEQIDPNTVSWQRLTDNGQWGPYRTVMAGYFGDRFWVLGSSGGGFGAYSYGVFSSTDGISWNSVATSIDSIPQAERQTAVFGFQDKMWLLGGLVPAKGFAFSYVTNQVWSSSDGATWSVSPRIATPAEGELWTGRERINAVVFQNKLWVIGGNNYPAFGNVNAPGVPLNDVWSTTDGASWTQVTATAPFVARTNPAVFVHNNKIYVAGGRNASGTLLNDIWMSEDGVSWSALAVNEVFTPVWGHQVLSYNGHLFLLGGYVKDDGNADVIQNGLWISEDDGTTWTKAEAGDPRALPNNFPGRAFFNAFVRDNAIWITGGEYLDGNNVRVYRNDTWTGALVK